MNIEKTNIVKSLAGRDKGRMFMVLDLEDENFALLVDGKLRRLESPKRKKLKHIKYVSSNNTRTGERMRRGEKVTNAEIRRTLSQLFEKDNEEDNNNNP
jgi:large subunit ribosomal protein L14e